MNDNKMSIELSLDTKDYDKKVDDAMRRLSELEKSLGKEHELDIPVKTNLDVLKEQLQEDLSFAQKQIERASRALNSLQTSLSATLKQIKSLSQGSAEVQELNKPSKEAAITFAKGTKAQIEIETKNLEEAQLKVEAIQRELENLNNIQINQSAEEMEENLEDINTETEDTINKWDILSGLISLSISGVKNLVSGIINVAKKTKDVINRVNPINKIINRIGRSISRQIYTSIASLLNPLNQFRKTFSYLTDVISPRLGATFKNIGNNLVEYIAGSSAFKGLINDALYFIKLLEIAWNKLASLLNIGKIDLFKTSAKSAKEMSKSAGSAAKSLASIDEITNLNSGGGGGEDTSPLSSEELFSEFDLGASIFDLINEKIYKLRDTLLEIDFYSIGDSLAEGLNHVINDVDWGAIVNTISIGLQGILDTFTGFFDKLDTQGLGKKINDIFKNLELGNIGEKLSNALISGLTSISSLLSEIDWSELGTQIAEFLLNIDWLGLLTSIIELIGEIIIGSGELLWGFLSTILSDIWNKFYSWLQSTPFGQTLISTFTSAIEAIKVIWDTVKPYFEELWKIIKALLEPVIEQIINIFKTAWDLIKVVWDEVVGYFGLLWDGIKAIFSVVKSVLSGDFEGAWDAIKEVWGKAKGFFEKTWENIKSVFSTVVSFFKNTFENAWNGVKKLLMTIASFFNKVVIQPIKNFFNFIISCVEGAANLGIKGINLLIKGLNKISIKVPDWVPDIGGKKWGFDIKPIDEISLPRLDVGTNYVPKDSLAMIHQGEAVIPKKFNEREFFGTGNEETNSLLEQLLDKVDNIDFNPYIGIKDVGKAAVSYINETSRQTGRRLV